MAVAEREILEVLEKLEEEKKEGFFSPEDLSSVFPIGGNRLIQFPLKYNPGPVVPSNDDYLLESMDSHPSQIVRMY